jgi:hypothetical protein
VPTIKIRGFESRPSGITSRAHRATGSKNAWIAPNGEIVPLPVIIDIAEIDKKSRNAVWLVEATVQLVNHEPQLTKITFENTLGIDPVAMSRDFRWGSPLELVRRVLPDLLRQGIDIWKHDLPLHPLTDFGSNNGRLSDDFLREISKQYLQLGGDYSRIIAAERGVSARTVIGWIQKARDRGLLSPTSRGHVGGELL